ncbi:MAG: thiamine pyrophosphate-binding protein [Polyangiales bacterium]|nr:thiamine pyrophosphate-binding protein [Myxococcales bacterium]MCB9658652.1 thiamine pyrophosphate-binding protein [Sandaracinaceae bacterium]
MTRSASPSAATALPLDPAHEPDAHRDSAPDGDRGSDIRGILSAPLSSSLAPDAAAMRLVQALLERGVDTYFGIPGGPVCPIFEALRMTNGVTLIESRHESNAAFAAAAYQRASGKTPCVVVTAGPGITNTVTGIASASLERIPMLVICGDVPWATHGGCLAQDSGPAGLGVEQILAPITRGRVRVAHARSAATQALAALDMANAPMDPGPALLVVPLDRATAPAPEVPVTPAAKRYVMAPDATATETAMRWLSGATRPLIVLGGACRGHEPAIQRLVDLLDVPFVTTPRAKGVVSELHPRSLRTGGMAASMWARRYTAEPVDVAIVLGTDLDDTSMGPTPYIGAGGRLVHVDINPAVFNRNAPTALAIQADVGAFADTAYEVAAREGLRNGACHATLRAIKRESAFDVPDFAGDDAPRIRPHRALADVQAAMAPDTRFITDIGEHMLFALHYLVATSSDQFQIHLNLGSMGSGIAGSVGVALADRARPVVCVCGDGGMQMAGMEALVAVRERLPVVFAVFNDARYNMVHHGMKQIFGQADAWESPHVDFASWSRAIGMPAAVIERPGEITPQLLSDLRPFGGPLLLDIRIDRESRIRGGGRVEALQHMSMLATGASGR